MQKLNLKRLNKKNLEEIRRILTSATSQISEITKKAEEYKKADILKKINKSF